MKKKFKDFFPMDKFSFEDLEIFPCGGGRVAFTQGYYYCPVLPKGENVIEFKQIKNTFIPQDEKPDKIFELKEKTPKHFYLKVTLDNKPLKIDAKPAIEGEIDSPYDLGEETKYYKPILVEISDDEICQPKDIGYPIFENVNKATEMPLLGTKGTFEYLGSKETIYYENLHPGPFSKKSKVFYIYLCSLYYEDNELSRLNYYMIRMSKDPSIVIPNPVRVVLANRHQTDVQNDRTMVIRNAAGGRVYKSVEGGTSVDYKERDFGDDAGMLFNDIKYNKRNEMYQNIYLDSLPKPLVDSSVNFDFESKSFKPVQTYPPDNSGSSYIEERMTFSPYPIVGISHILVAKAFIPDNGQTPTVIG